jgi:hypothetical protein
MANEFARSLFLKDRRQTRGAAPPVDTPRHSSGYTTSALRQDGRDGVLWSPLWQIRIELTALERALLQTWPVRRLCFLHHNGASVFAYPLNTSRLQHTIGVLALVSHFCPDRDDLRAAALLHDVGHYPFCHSAELVPGVDHHAMTRHRVTSEPLSDLLIAHGQDPREVLALMDGAPSNPLRTHNGLLHLDHLDSWVRLAQAAGYARCSPNELLSQLRLENHNVAAAGETAEYLVWLIRKGNERHYAEGDIGPACVLAYVVMLALERCLLSMEEFAAATDEALLARLAIAGDEEITKLVMLLRKEPWRISVSRAADGETPSPDPATPTLILAGQPELDNTIAVRLRGLYDAVPLLAGTAQPITRTSSNARAELAKVKTLPGVFTVAWR